MTTTRSAPSTNSSSRTTTRPYAPIIYSRLGDLYVEKERFQDAAAVYRAFATREPNSEFSPGLSMQAIDAYRKGGFTELVLEGKREYVALYNYGTPFWQGRNKADYPNIAKELKTNLKDVATYFHAEAQKTKKVDQYREAARWYRTYLESFPDDPESFGTNYLLSETLYSSEDYQGAAAEFAKTAYDYPRNPRSAAAAYAALGSYTKYEEKLPAGREGRGAQARGGCRREVRHQLSRASRQRRRADARRRRHLRDARICSARSKWRTWCSRTSRRPISRSAASPTPSSASRTSICCSSPKRRRATSPRATCCRPTTRCAPISPSASPRRCIARPKPSRRRATASAPSTTSCASRRSRAPRRSPRRPSTTRARSSSTLKEWPRAIQVLERFRANNPKSEFTADVTRKLAVAYGETGQAGQAAVEFERIAMNPAEIEGHPARGQSAGGGSVREGGQHAEGRRHARALRRRLSDAGGRLDRGAPEARRHRGHRRQHREAALAGSARS